MIQHYFVSSWIGSGDDSGNVIYSSPAEKNTAAIIGIRTNNISIKAGENKTIGSKLWLGLFLFHYLKFLTLSTAS